MGIFPFQLLQHAAWAKAKLAEGAAAPLLCLLQELWGAGFQPCAGQPVKATH